jgi:AraC family transcriptional regulator
LNVDRLASIGGVPPRRFAAVFREKYRMSVREALVLFRVQRAAELLRSTDDKVDAVAFTCGFVSRASFYRAFRRHLGCAPREV